MGGATPRGSGVSVPLRLQVMSLFAALVGVVGVALAWYDYDAIRRAAVLESEAAVLRGERTVQHVLAADERRAGERLRLLRALDLVAKPASWADARRSPPLTAAVEGDPVMTAAYVGYPDGRFVLLRPLPTPEERERWDAPRRARYVLQVIPRAGAASISIFWDGELRELARAPHPEYRLDPRERLWFAYAQENRPILTSVYRFRSGQLGYTTSLRSADGAVVGLDVTLSALSQRLTQVLPARGALAAVVDPGFVVAAATPGALRGPTRLTTVLARALDGGATLRDENGRIWRTSVTQVGTTLGGPRMLVFAIPQDVLLAPAVTVRNETLIVGAIVLIVAIPLIWWAFELVAAPLKRVQEQAEALAALDFADHPDDGSVIVELNRLAFAFRAVRVRIARFLELGEQLATERDLARILSSALAEMVDATNASGGAIALVADARLQPAFATGTPVPPGVWDEDEIGGRAIDEGCDVSGPIDVDGTAGLAVPIPARDGGAWGSAVLARAPRDAQPFSEGSHRYATAVAGSAAIAIEAASSTESLERYGKAATRFVPRAFVELLGHDDIRSLALGDAIERRMIVLFVHLHGFEGLLAGGNPAAALATLDRFFGSAGPTIRAHGGFVDKYVGDMLMALFPDDADAAVAAATEIIRSVAEQSATWSAEHGLTLRAGAGIHSGRLMLGTIGERERYETTVIADAVNVASRISGLTAQLETSLLVSGEVAADLRTTARRRVCECAVKGARRPFPLVEIFETDPPALATAKTRTRAQFEKAWHAFAAGDAGGAATYYRSIVAAVPDDRVAASMLARCAGGIAPDWDGVLRFASK